MLQKNCKALGGRVLRQAAAKRIFIDEKGRVTGVLSRTKEKEIKLITKSVVIAMGG